MPYKSKLNGNEMKWKQNDKNKERKNEKENSFSLDKNKCILKNY